MEREHQESLIRTLQNCVKTCNICFEACLNEEHVEMMADCIRLDRECAEVCSLLGQFVSRGSQFTTELAGLCAKVCEACGNECKKHNHEHCQRCAQICFACAEECHRIAA
ncbi:four-helix bundle copper-binding protein [Aciduricibacillus chroicocephali]|uniref:Four-helix bundle copper-binding protein n=1 Tax=Aciduricibacillus chroicocephali TaxID=3054939 RepID=A0ABY9KWH9_9BACI|nr:four-helix bundle copper-binding protein [Bacillaceae bacterium 44XB]